MDIRETAKPAEIITDVEKLGERVNEVSVRKDSAKIMRINRMLKATIRDNPSIRGLSAPQIGEPYRICDINYNGNITCYVNPMIHKADGVCLSKETSESLPGRQFIAVRNHSIEVQYTEPNGKLNNAPLVGEAAFIMQQMLDYLQGITLEDHALEIDDDYENATDEEKQQIINLYLDSLDIQHKDLMDNINGDAEEKELYKGIDFMEKVQTGEVKLTQQQFDVVQESPKKEKKPRITKKTKIK